MCILFQNYFQPRIVILRFYKLNVEILYTFNLSRVWYMSINAHENVICHLYTQTL